jgi:hypothetical protein
LSTLPDESAELLNPEVAFLLLGAHAEDALLAEMWMLVGAAKFPEMVGLQPIIKSHHKKSDTAQPR